VRRVRTRPRSSHTHVCVGSPARTGMSDPLAGHPAAVPEQTSSTPPPATPCVVVGVSTAAAPSYDGRADALVTELAARLRTLHPSVGWDVRHVSDPGTGHLSRSPSVASLMARGRNVLLAGDLDVVLVLVDSVPELRGRPVTSHVSPVQQVAVLHVRPGDTSTAAEADRLVAAVVGLDEEPDDQELLRQLASAAPAGAQGADLVRRTVTGNLRLLVTLVRGNRPWLMTLHLSRTLTGAFAASFLAVVTPDFWLLADRMSATRLVLLTLAVLGVLCGVLVIGGGLRERAPSRAARRAVLLHNVAVWVSVAIGVGTLYLGLVAADLAVTAVVLPLRLLRETLGHPAGVDTVLRVGALTGAVALVGSAFGAGLEDDEDVHTATYTGSDDARYADVERS
jgi:uncharacterized membrane protein